MYPDVVVIGGGVVGCSCAYYLARTGLGVELVERAALGSGTSKAGQCHLMCWELPEISVRLALASKMLWEQLSEELPVDIEYRRTGSLALLEASEVTDSFGKMIKELRGLGLRAELLAAEDITRLEPNVASHVAGGGYFPDDAQLNPILATWGLAQGAIRHGAMIQTFSEVTGIELSRSREVVAVKTTIGRIPTGNVVVAAGAWSKSIGEMAGVDVPVEPRKGHLVVTIPVPGGIFNTQVILEAGYIDTVHAGSGLAVAANLQQTRTGSLMLGSSREFVGFDLAVNPEVISAMLQRRLHFYPCLRQLHAIRTWAGLRPYSPDTLPIIGPADDVKGLYIATGHEGRGITTGPITGTLISQSITGQQGEPTMTQLAPGRFRGQVDSTASRRFLRPRRDKRCDSRSVSQL